MNRFFRWLGLALLLLLAVLLVNTFRSSSKQLSNVAPAPALDNRYVPDSAVGHLTQALRLRTVSYYDDSLTDTTQFEKFIQFIARAYPETHRRLRLERINRYALLFTWPGRNPALRPAVLMGHYDVVPVIQGTERMWQRPPFAGRVDGGYIYGRGTLDDKTTVIGLLEATEYLLRSGFQPERTMLLAFGPDEEVTGRGARAVVEVLKQRRIAPEYVMDEGGTVKTDGLPGLFERPLALVGIGEKGFVSVELQVIGEGGHSSMPPPQTSIGILAGAVATLEANPLPARLDAGLDQLFSYVGPELAFLPRLLFANQWLFGPVIRSVMARTPSTDATQRTTTALTVLRAGVKDNVLPIDATAVVNFRILPGESVASVLQHVRDVVADDRVQVRLLPNATPAEPSALSSADNAPFQLLHRTIKRVYPDATVAPYLMLGATDSRFYRAICPNVFNFMPVRMTTETLKMTHGTNERIAVPDFHDAVKFYVTLLRAN